MRLFTLGLCIAFGCGKSPQATTTPIKDPVPMVETKAAAPTPATATLAAYERVRVLLAADEIKGVGEAARALETEATKAQYTVVAAHASKLAAAADLDAARAEFGEVSREIVALLAKDPALAKGQHVFECPMAKGYRKWVQPNEDMANPYMGKKMLACGGESTWQ